ncbi:hypothetical protein JCM9534A_25000 [Catenuloplanes indicus JCM 9534]
MIPVRIGSDVAPDCRTSVRSTAASEDSVRPVGTTGRGGEVGGDVLPGTASDPTRSTGPVYIGHKIH